MKNKKLFGDMSQLATVYTAGLVIGIFLWLLARIKIVKIIHSERFPHFRGKVILVSNHPSLMEPLLIVCLCWMGYLLHPFRLTPIGVIDGINLGKKDVYGKSWLWWIRRFTISVSRNGEKNIRGLREILSVVNSGRPLLIFPEAGRTSTGGKCVFSPSGHRIRKVLDEGCVNLARSSRTPIIPIWFNWNVPFGKLNIFFPFRELLSGKLTIIIGEEFSVDRGEDRAEATLRLRDTLLKLAEKNL